LTPATLSCHSSGDGLQIENDRPDETHLCQDEQGSTPRAFSPTSPNSCPRSTETKMGRSSKAETETCEAWLGTLFWLLGCNNQMQNPIPASTIEAKMSQTMSVTCFESKPVSLILSLDISNSLIGTPFIESFPVSMQQTFEIIGAFVQKLRTYFYIRIRFH
jgi:hypothetical protein